MNKVCVLTGLGIECEKESLRFFARPELGLELMELPVPFLLRRPDALDALEAGDLVFLPGGFSFSDHFGSGRLLAFELAKAGVFETLQKRGVHMVGVCNGFQVLVSAGLFGPGLRLEANEVGAQALGFINRWVSCEITQASGAKQLLRLPVRHGEGRLTLSAAELPAGVQAFLHYQDFDNGSWQGIAGLKVRRGKSHIFGLMPHPEIAARPVDDPDIFATDVFAEHRPPLQEASGGGMTLFQSLLSEMRNAP